jgi:manganese transport protein
MRLVYTTVGDWLGSAGEWRGILEIMLFPILAGLLLLLLWVVAEPLLPAVLQRRGRMAPVIMPAPGEVAENLPAPLYRRLMVPLDHTGRDRAAVAHAAALARTFSAKVVLVHVEEGVTSQVYGQLANTAEVEAGQSYLTDVADRLRASGIDVSTVVAHADVPAEAIARVARECNPDLVVMAAHGHTGLKDLIFGATINDVRHRLNVPILVVRGE